MFKLEKPKLSDPVSLEVLTYPCDTVLKIKRHGMPMRFYSGGRRARIERMTGSSARRLAFFLRNLAGLFTTMLTLTYPSEYEHDGKRVKNHLKAFLAFLRRRDIKYAWVLEFQERGAPHFHFLLSGRLHKNDVAECWYRIVGSKDERHLHAGTRIEAIESREKMAHYLSGYLAKQAQKEVPANYLNCGRFWGISRVLRAGRWSVTGSYRGIAAYIRQYRRWQKVRASREWGFRWEWSGYGFCLRGGATVPPPETVVSETAARPLAKLLAAEGAV